MKVGQSTFKRGIALALAFLLLGQIGTMGAMSVHAEDNSVQAITELPADTGQPDPAPVEEPTLPTSETVPELTEPVQMDEVVQPEPTAEQPQETEPTPMPVSDTQVFWNPNANGKYNEEGALIVNGGNDANDGQTANAPVLSLQKALELAGTAKEIVCMNLCELNGDTTIQNATFVAYDGGRIPEAAHDGAFFSVKQGNLTLSNVNISKTDVVVELEGGTLTLGEGMQLAGEIVLTQPSETNFPIVMNQPNTTNDGKYKVNCNSDYPGVVAVAQGDHLNDFVLSDLLLSKNWELYIENGNTYARMVNDPIIEYEAIYLDGVNGDDANLGNASGCPVKTFQRAKDLMKQHAAEGVHTIYVMNTVTIQDSEVYELKSTGATDPEVQRYNYACNSLFVIADGAAPTFAFAIEDTYFHSHESSYIDVAVDAGGTLTLADGFHTYEASSGCENITVFPNSSLIVQGQDVRVDSIGAMGTVTMTAGAVNKVSVTWQNEVTVSGGTVKHLHLADSRPTATVTGNAVVEESRIYKGTLHSEGGHIKHITLETENSDLYINGAGTIDGIMLQSYKPSIYLSGEPQQADPIVLELGDDMKNDQVVVHHYDPCDASKHLDKFMLLESEKRYYLSTREKDIILKPCGVFVDTDKGDDQNSGLRDDQPVKTFAKAAELMNYHAMQPGSELPHDIYVMNTGTTGAQIYGDDKLIIDPALTDVQVIPYVGENCEAMLRITDGNSFTAENVQFDREMYFEKYINKLFCVEGGTTNLTNCRIECVRVGLHVVDGVVNVDNCVFNGQKSEKDHYTAERSAVKTSGGKVNIQNTVIKNTRFDMECGGVWAETGSCVNIINCLFQNNFFDGSTRKYGVCVYAGAGSKVYMEDVAIQKNNCGGIYWDCDAELVAGGTINISENEIYYSYDNIHGIYIGSSSSHHTPHKHVLDEHFKINNNRAKSKGAGVYVACSDTVMLQNCDLSGNTCSTDASGTAVYVEQGTLEYHNATLTGCSGPLEGGTIFVAEDAVLQHLEGTIEGSVCARGLYQLDLGGKDVGVTDKIYLENAYIPLTLIGSYAKLNTPLVVAPSTGFIGQTVIDGSESCPADLQNFQVENLTVAEKNFDVVAEESKFVFWDPQNQGGKSSDVNDGSCPVKAVITWGRVRQILAQKKPGTKVVMCSTVDGTIWKYLGVDENGAQLTVLDGQIGEGDGAWNTQIVRGAPAKGRLLTEKMFDSDTMDLELKNITLNGQFYADGDAITSGLESFGIVNADRLSLTNVTVCDYVTVSWPYDCEAIVANWLNDQNVTYTRNVGHLARVQWEWHADEDRVIGNSILQGGGPLFRCNNGSVVRNCVFSGNNLGFSIGSALVQSFRGLTMEDCQIGAEKPGKIPQSPEECLAMGGNVVGEVDQSYGSPYGLIDGCNIARNVTIYGNWLESPAFYTGKVDYKFKQDMRNMRVEGNYSNVNALYIFARYGCIADVEDVQCVNNSVACAMRVVNANMKNCVISGNKRCNNGGDKDGVGLDIFNEYGGGIENCQVLENEGDGVIMTVRYATCFVKDLECKKNGGNGLVANVLSGGIAFSGVNEISENKENGITKKYYDIQLTKDETDPSAKLLVHHNGKHGIGCDKYGDAKFSGLSIYENAGAGVFLRDQEKLIVHDSDIYSNHGGGVECDNYEYTIQADLYDTKIRDNQGKRGAGLHIGRKCIVNLHDVTITGNTAEEYGGGIAMDYGNSFDTTVHVHSGTIRDNQSKGDGNKSSGIYSDAYLKMGGGKVDIDDTIYLADRAKPITLTNSMSAGDNYTISLNQEGERGFKLGNVVVQPNPDAFPSNVAQYVRFTSAYDESLVFAKGSATPGGKVDSIVLKRCIFVDGVGGSDTNLGKNPNDAYKTMEKALEEAANGNAVIFVSGPVTGSGNWDCSNPVEIKRYTGFAIGGLHAYPPYVEEMIHVPAGETLTVGANILGVYGRHTEDDPVVTEGSIFHVDGTLRLENELNIGGNGSQKMTGGAIYVSESGNVQITAPVAISSTKAQDGGAIYNKGTVTVGEGGSLVLDRTSASGKGSAVYQAGTFTVQAGSSLTTDGVIYLDTDCYLTLGNETVVFPKGIRLDIASPSDGRIYAKYLNRTNVDPDAEQNRYELMGHLTSIYLLEHRVENDAINLILSTSNVVYLDPLYTGGPQEDIGKQGCKADYPVTTLQDAYRYLQERGGLIYIVTPVHIDEDVTLGLNQCTVGSETVTLNAGSVYIRRYSKPESDIFGFQKAPTNDQALFEVEKGSSLTLDGLTLDGHATAVTGASEKYSFTNAPAVDTQYPLVMVKDGTALTLHNGAILKNNHNITAEKAHEGDAVNNDQTFAIEQQAEVEGTVKLGTEDFVTVHGGKTSPVPSMHILLDDPRDGRVIAQYDEAPVSEEKDKYILEQSILDVYKVVIEGDQVLLRDKGAAYVDGVAGDDTRDGTTPENAVKTLKQAYANLQKDGGGTIYIVDTVTVDQYMILLGNQYIDLKDNIEVPGNVRILRYSQPDAAASLTGFQVPSFTGAMLNVTGDLTLKNITMDGHGNAVKTDSEKTTAGAVQAVQPMLTVAGQLTLDKGAVLCSNHNTAGNGGAVFVDSTGKLTVFEAELADNQAVHGSGVALYDSIMTTTAHPGFANDQYVYLDGAQDTEGSRIHVTNQLDAQVVIPVELPDYYFTNGHKIAEYDDYAPDGIQPNKTHFALQDDKHLMEDRMLGIMTENEFVLLRAEYSVRYELTDLSKTEDSPVKVQHQTAFSAKLLAEAPIWLPSEVVVRVQPSGQTEEVILQPGTDYTYDPATGEINVLADSVTGHVTIVAVGERAMNLTYDVTLTARESRNAGANSTVTLELVDGVQDVNLNKLQGKTFTLETCELPAGVTLDTVEQLQTQKYSAGSAYANGTFAITVSVPGGTAAGMDQIGSNLTFAAEEKLIFNLYNANAITDATDLSGIKLLLRSDAGDEITINLTIKRVASQINVSVPLVLVMRSDIDGGTAKVDDAVYNVKNLSSMDVSLDAAEIADNLTDHNMTFVANGTDLSTRINAFTVVLNGIPKEIAYGAAYNPISSMSTSRLNFVTKDQTSSGQEYGVHMADVRYTVTIPEN